MKTKILIILIILVVLVAGGFFLYKNILVPETEKEEVPLVLLPSVNLPAGYELSAIYIAPLAAPTDIEITPQGDLLVTENGLPRIRKVTLSGEVSTYITLPQSATALAYNDKGELFAGGGPGIFKISSEGKISVFSQISVSRMVLGPDGAFYTVDWHTASPDIKKITPKGKVTTFATGLSHASDIAFSPSGELYVADPGSQRILKVNTDGTMTTLVTGLWTDPTSLVFDKHGNLFFAGLWAGKAGKIDWEPQMMGLYKISLVDGSITSVVLAPDIAPFDAMAIDDLGNIFGAVVNHGILYKISPEGKIEIIVEGWHDGFGLAVGPTGDIFVADRTRFPSKPGRIFKLDMNGNVALFADGLRDPMGLAFDTYGNLFVVEMSGRVLKITPEGQIRVLSQIPKVLRSITFDPISGDLFVFAVGTDEIIRITPEGILSILPVKFDKDIFGATLAADGQGNILAHVTYKENYGVGPTISDLFKITLDGKKTLLAHFVDEVPAWEGSIAVSPSGDSFLLAHPFQAFKIRKVTPEGNVSVFADNLPIDPFAIAMNKEGDIFFTSALGIFKISPK